MFGKSRIALSSLAILGIVATGSAADAGQFSFSVTPKGQDAELVRNGFALYNIYRSSKKSRNRAKVDQRGSGNAAAVSQSGSDNWAGVFQRGKGHSATVSQSGRNNAFGVFQFGKNTSASAAQTGDGNVGFLFQGGW